MESSAIKLIDNINEGLSWIKKHKPEQYDRRFLQLVEERRKLRILANAEQNNPGIAAFGQSQVGKSYLMNCILQDGNTPFMVDAPDKEHNFIDEINPIGGGQEATGVVTRFSSFSRNPGSYNPNYPIRFRSLSVKDIILIICDSYFNDFDDYTTAGEMELLQRCEDLYAKYISNGVQAFPVLIADDILDIKLYFRQHINNGQVYSVKTPFFDNLAQIIDKVPIADYVSIFSILWNNEMEFTNLFNVCMNILQRLKFSEYVYLPISAVLHGGIKQDTIMSVSCLELLYSSEASKYTTDAFVGTPKDLHHVGSFTKSELCSVCSEVVIRIKDKFLNGSGRYDTRDLPLESLAYLTKGDVSMAILKECDLLDFPGARARGDLKLAKLNNKDNKATLMYAYLRGKVAYLFNKYNEEKIINILLYCHHNRNNDATEMWQLLDRWVKEYVGDTPEKRASFISKTEVSPLFHIGTMFNLDLAESENKVVGNTEEGILNRWNQRFYDLLSLKCFRKQDVQWVDKWIGVNKPFQNCYLLRDFKFSGNIYSGFKTEGKEESMIIERGYYETMRRTFCQSSEERHHLFANPALSWDVAASIGNDGALYIIEQLSKVAKNISKARESQIAEQIDEAKDVCYEILHDFYVSDDTTVLLAENIRKANAIFRELEFTCQSQPEYFGHLLQALQLTEAESFKELHQLIPTLTSTVNDASVIKDYELVRKRCNNFKDCKNEEEKWACLIAAYRFTNQKEAEEYLLRKGIDPKKLFQGETLKRKNSAVISNHLVTLWEKKISGVQFANSFSGKDSMDEIVMTYLITCLVSTAKNVQLTQRIETEIADYVNILNTAKINESLIADMIATTISDFVMDFGYSYLDPDVVARTRRVSSEQHLSCFEWVEKERTERLDEDGMTQLFNDILSSTYQYTPAYEASYNSWLNYLYIAFIAFINVPDYDHEANEKLKTILERLK